MSQIKKKKIIKESKRKFHKHKWIHVYVKQDASVPYENPLFTKIISDSKNEKLKHTKFVLYIHEEYLTISSKDFIFDPVKIAIDDKLWIELYCVFNLVNENENSDLSDINDNDDEPI